jgi:AbiV family abortive infection protein
LDSTTDSPQSRTPSQGYRAEREGERTRPHQDELSSDELVQLFDAIVANCRELTRSGRILLDADRFVHAYSLFHQGAEELAKADLVLAQWLVLISGGDPEWQLFWRAFRDHQIKLRMSLYFGRLAEELRSVGVDDQPPDLSSLPLPSPAEIAAAITALGQVFSQLYRATRADPPVAQELHRRRLDTTYVDWRSGKLNAPDGSVSRRDAEDLLGFLQSNLDRLMTVWSFRSYMMKLTPILAPQLEPLWDEILSFGKTTAEAQPADPPVNQFPPSDQK